MKKTITFLATVAFSCCGISSSFAQIQILGGSPTPAPMLISVSTPVAQEALGNPFDFVDAEATAEDFPLSEEANSSPSDADPSSLPVGRHLRKRTIVDTVNDHATVSAVPNATMAPVFWNQLVRTPNPVAEILLRDDCNARDLWVGYPEQRAAECAHMWSTIAGSNRHCGCAAQTGCSACQAPVRNRYTQQAQSGVCDQQPASITFNNGEHAAVPETAEGTAEEIEKQRKLAFLKLPWTR